MFPAPYMSTNLTFELKTHSLVHVEITANLNTGQRMAKVCLAFIILAALSLSVPPDWLILHPRYTNSLTSSNGDDVTHIYMPIVNLDYAEEGKKLLLCLKQDLCRGHLSPAD